MQMRCVLQDPVSERTSPWLPQDNNTSPRDVIIDGTSSTEEFPICIANKKLERNDLIERQARIFGMPLWDDDGLYLGHVFYRNNFPSFYLTTLITQFAITRLLW